nr:hypothetical transcript [Hymenolepis microstoma]
MSNDLMNVQSPGQDATARYDESRIRPFEPVEENNLILSIYGLEVTGWRYVGSQDATARYDESRIRPFEPVEENNLILSIYGLEVTGWRYVGSELQFRCSGLRNTSADDDYCSETHLSNGFRKRL